jgi:hypothetical protein
MQRKSAVDSMTAALKRLASLLRKPKMTTQADKDAILEKLDEAADLVTALPVDPDVNPLQAQLDAANAMVLSLQGEKNALQAKIDAAKAAAQADKDADAANVAGQGVLDALA